MRVLLINCPGYNSAYITTDWDRTPEDIGAFPPIGLSYIAGYLKTHTSHEVSILDALSMKMSYDDIYTYLKNNKYDVVGATIFTPVFYDALELAKTVKSADPDCYFVVGGTQHMRMFLNETLTHENIDFAVRGEGEIVFSDLLDALEGNRKIEDVQGISYILDGSVISQGEEGYIKDLNLLPSPAFDLLPTNLYRSAIGTGSPVGTITSSRGCPFNCIFCDHPYTTYRQYSIDRIISEIDYFYKMNIKEIFFFDDMFNINPNRVIEISKIISANYKDLTWSFRGRVDQISDEMCMIARDSGCKQIMFGIEVATNEDLRFIRKKVTIEQLLSAIKLCKKYDMEVSTNWIIGLPPHKTTQDLDHLIDLVKSCGTDFCQFNIMVPYAGTYVFDLGVEKGLFPKDVWNKYVLKPEKHWLCPFWSEFFTRDELSVYLKKCYKEFYLRPKYVLMSIVKIRSLTEFFNKLRGLRTVLGFGGFKRRNT